MRSTSVFTYHLQSPIGVLEIIGNDGFILSIDFLDNDKESSSETILVEMPVVMNNCVEEFQSYFKGELKNFSFKYQQAGSDFRQSVWKQLQKIPYADTVSYLEISKRLGDVKAIRAAASANGKNRIAIVVPCHRVIGSDGSLTGYAGGLWRKKWLLEHEQKFGGNTHQLRLL